MQDQAIYDRLIKKDEEDFSQYVPKAWKMSRDEARFSLYEHALDTDYRMQHIARCVQPCFTNMDSPVVSLREAECMTNCTGKAIEALALFKYNFAMAE